MNGEKTRVIEAKNVWKWFGADRTKAVIQGVTLTVRGGEWVALAGHSGSGKTTLLSLLGALDFPSEGEIWFGGVDLPQLSDVALARIRRRMGLVFQDPLLIPRMPLWDNVSQPLIPLGVSRALRRERALLQLSRVRLTGCADRTPETLSGGERQRAALARALVGDPEVLLADEPTASLDPDTAQAVIQILREYIHAGHAVIVATHDPALLELAHSVYYLQNGLLIPGRMAD